MIFFNVLLLIVGFVMLVKGADWFVDGAAGIAGKMHIPELIVGLTVVAFGTSAPELSVSITSVFNGAGELTIGNVIGSNITNILLILGLTAIVCAIPVHQNSLKVDMPFLLLITLLFTVLGSFGHEIERWNGILLFALLIGYIAFLIFQALRERKKALALGKPLEEDEEEDEPKTAFGRWYKNCCRHTWFLLIALVVGLALVVLGSDLVVSSATYIAESLGVSDRIIGLTVIAIGTSLPELVTSVTAAVKGKTDIAVGNILGSNIFNLLCVAGFTAILKPLAFSAAFVVDSIIMLAVTVLLALLCYLKGHKIRRYGGIIMILCFIGYYIYLFLV